LLALLSALCITALLLLTLSLSLLLALTFATLCGLPFALSGLSVALSGLAIALLLAPALALGGTITFALGIAARGVTVTIIGSAFRAVITVCTVIAAIIITATIAIHIVRALFTRRSAFGVPASTTSASALLSWLLFPLLLRAVVRLLI
jgi:hypothetical protein